MNYLKMLMNVSGERFEFEMNMLIDSKQNQIKIKEVPIQTIYLEENKSSHFNPLVDSLKIYSVFLKFILSSFASFIINTFTPVKFIASWPTLSLIYCT